MTINGSAPDATACGRGASGGSWDRSSSQGKEAQERPPLLRNVIANSPATLDNDLRAHPERSAALPDPSTLVRPRCRHAQAVANVCGRIIADHPPTLAVRNNLCETALPTLETTMGILNLLCGMAVLFTTLALAHLIHHHAGHASSSDFHSRLSLFVSSRPLPWRFSRSSEAVS